MNKIGQSYTVTVPRAVVEEEHLGKRGIGFGIHETNTRRD
jgi:hypothetical protein